MCNSINASSTVEREVLDNRLFTDVYAATVDACTHESLTTYYYISPTITVDFKSNRPVCRTLEVMSAHNLLVCKGNIGIILCFNTMMIIV